MANGPRRKHWIQLSLFAFATDGEKEILRTILSTHKREMSTTQLRARTLVDLYVEENSVHTLCQRLRDKNLLQVRRGKLPGCPGKPQNIFTVTPQGVEALRYD